MTRFASLLAVLALALSACAPAATRAPEPDPLAVVEAWHAALADGRPRDAFRLLHADATEGLDEAGFVALYERQRDALMDQAAALLEVARHTPPVLRAVVRVGDEDAALIHTAEGWRLEAPLRSGPVTGTAPEDTPPAP